MNPVTIKNICEFLNQDEEKFTQSPLYKSLTEPQIYKVISLGTTHPPVLYDPKIFTNIHAAFLYKMIEEKVSPFKFFNPLQVTPIKEKEKCGHCFKIMGSSSFSWCSKCIHIMAFENDRFYIKKSFVWFQ